MRHRPAAIRQFLTQQSASGQTVADFCADRDLKVPTFYSWRRKYATAPPDPQAGAGFCQLRPTAEPIVRGLRLPSGLRVELSGLTVTEMAALILEIDRAHA